MKDEKKAAAAAFWILFVYQIEIRFSGAMYI